MSLLDLLGVNRIFKAGTPVDPTRKILNFIGDVTVVDNPGSQRTDITIGAGGGGGGGGGGGEGTVSGPATSTAGHVATWAGTDGTTLADGGKALAALATTASVTAAISTALEGRDLGNDGAKLDGIEAGAQVTSAARVLSALAAAAADVSINTHKLTNVVNPASPQDAATKAYVDAAITAPGAGWRTYCDFNFTQMANQTINQGLNGIDGVQMRADFVVNASTFAIVNGTGLYVKNTTAPSSFYYSGRNAPMLYVDLPVDVPGWILGSSEVRISAEWLMTASTADYSASGFGVAKHPFVANQELSVHWLHQRATTIERRLSRLSGATESSPIVANTYNAGMIHFRSQYDHVWYGKSNVDANSAPNAVVLDPRTMTPVGSMLVASPSSAINVATPYIANLDHLLAFWTGHSDNTLGTSEHVCKRLRIEYRL